MNTSLSPSRTSPTQPLFAVMKALAIIFVVVSHAGAPSWLTRFVFQFHVPVFFLCAGYFFSTKYLRREADFVGRRFKGLYLPFVKWSLFFLVLHNLLFPLGILNEQYGNAAGGVLHPYSWQQFCQRAWNIVTNMSGYDEFLGGSFWFFRSLFVASLLFLLLLRASESLPSLRSPRRAAWAILAGSTFLLVWKSAAGLSIPGLAGGGSRELMALALMAAGFLLHIYRRFLRYDWPALLGTTAILVVFAAVYPTSMAVRPSAGQALALLVTGVAGFCFLRGLSAYVLLAGSAVSSPFVYIGRHTLYVFAFHLAAFKVVSAVKVACYGLPWFAVGGHPVVQAEKGDLFWLLYVLAGVSLPLLWREGYLWLERHYDLSFSHLCRVNMRLLVRAFRLCRHGAVCLWHGLKAGYQAFKAGAKEVIEASTPKEEEE